MDQKLILEGWPPAKKGPCSQPSHEENGTRSCIAFQLGAFLKDIAGSRHAVLSQLKSERFRRGSSGSTFAEG